MKYILFILISASYSSLSQVKLLFSENQQQSFNFFLTGECHLKTDYNHYYSLFAELYQTHQVRNIILEVPQEYEYDLNKFINSKETTVGLINLGAITLHDEPGYYRFMERLKEFNLSIKDTSQRISVTCADISPMLSNALFRLSLIDQEGTTSNTKLFHTIKKAGRIGIWGTSKNNSRKIKLVYQLKHLLKDNEQDFHDLYKQNFGYVKRMILSMCYNADVYKEHEKYVDSLREKCMYENITRVYRDFPNEKYYGNFGMVHLSLAPYEKGFLDKGWGVSKSLACMLKETPGISPMSIVYYYVNIDEIAKSCRMNVYGEDILTDDEKIKYLTDVGQNYFFVPIDEIKNHEKLKSVFHGLIISGK